MFSLGMIADPYKVLTLALALHFFVYYTISFA